MVMFWCLQVGSSRGIPDRDLGLGKGGGAASESSGSSGCPASLHTSPAVLLRMFPSQSMNVTLKVGVSPALSRTHRCLATAHPTVHSPGNRENGVRRPCPSQ